MTQISDTRKLLIVQVVRSVLYLLNSDTIVTYVEWQDYRQWLLRGYGRLSIGWVCEPPMWLATYFPSYLVVSVSAVD